MSQPAGWYDDPQNPDNLRYWDGVTWTQHTTTRVSPTASQSTIGRVDPVGPPPAAQPQWSGQIQRDSQSPSPGGPVNPYQNYQSAPPEQAWMAPGGTTVDGVPLASWGRRVGAWLIDGVLIQLIATALGWRWIAEAFRAVEPFTKRIEAGEEPTSAFMQDMISAIVPYLMPVMIVQFLVGLVYCVGFWTRTGQTPGKMVLGISVRLQRAPGPLPVGAALLRRIFVDVLGFLPGGGILRLLDGLWPLWDTKKQTWHDKIAKTQVVVGKQPRKP